MVQCPGSTRINGFLRAYWTPTTRGALNPYESTKSPEICTEPAAYSLNMSWLLGPMLSCCPSQNFQTIWPWLVVEPTPSEKLWVRQLGWCLFPTEWTNRIHVPVTTNQDQFLGKSLAGTAGHWLAYVFGRWIHLLPEIGIAVFLDKGWTRIEQWKQNPGLWFISFHWILFGLWGFLYWTIISPNIWRVV